MTRQTLTPAQEDAAFNAAVGPHLINSGLIMSGAEINGRAICEGFRSSTRTYALQVVIGRGLTSDPAGFVTAATQIFCPQLSDRLPVQ